MKAGISWHKTGKSFIGKTYAECRSHINWLWYYGKGWYVYVMCTDIGWSILVPGVHFTSIRQLDKKGKLNNQGRYIFLWKWRNIFNISPGKIAVIQGSKTILLWDSENVLLIVKKEEEQNIKQYLEDVKNSTKESFCRRAPIPLKGANFLHKENILKIEI